MKIFKELLYFTVWLLKSFINDIKRHYRHNAIWEIFRDIGLTSLLISLMVFIVGICMLDDTGPNSVLNAGLWGLGFSLILLLCSVIVLIIVEPIINKYHEFKREQKNMINVLRK